MSLGLGIELTADTADAQFTLGHEHEEYHPTLGKRVWVYIKNVSGGALAAGEVVMKPNGGTYDVTKAATGATRMQCLGVAQHALTQNYYGFVLRRGVGEVMAAAAVTADTDLTPGTTAGRVIDFAANAEHRVIGHATEAQGTAGQLLTAFLDM